MGIFHTLDSLSTVETADTRDNLDTLGTVEVGHTPDIANTIGSAGCLDTLRVIVETLDSLEGRGRCEHCGCSYQ